MESVDLHNAIPMAFLIKSDDLEQSVNQQILLSNPQLHFNYEVMNKQLARK